MSTYTRARTPRQIDHIDSSTISHKRDKAEGERRRAFHYIRVPAPDVPTVTRSFPATFTGHAFTFTAEGWTRCTKPGEFARYLRKEARRRAFYIGNTKRNGQPILMRRRVRTPLEYLTTTFPPWLSDWALAEFKAGRNPLPALAQIRNRWIGEVMPLYAGQRHILGLAFHADTDDPHFDLCVSRQDGMGGRKGSRGLHLVGPWCIATDRQVRAGVTLPAEKLAMIQASVANFRHLYGPSAIPRDIAAARSFDREAEAIIGPSLTPFRTNYAAAVAIRGASVFPLLEEPVLKSQQLPEIPTL